MKIEIVGAGGVGGYFGARLAASGAEVTFVARGAHLAAMQRDGLQVRSALGDVTVQPVQAVDDVSKIERADLVIIAVKLWDTADIAKALRPLADTGAAFLSLQNGVGKDDILRDALSTDSVLGGSCYIAAVIEAPGVIRHNGTLQRIVVGEYGRAARSARVEAFHAACVAAGIDAQIHADIERNVWEKFVFLVSLSGATAATRQPVGVLRANPNTRALLLDLMQETLTVGRARGVALPADFAERQLAFYDTLPPGMLSSMANDLERGNRLELPWLSGAVADMGTALGVPTPMNTAVQRVLAPYMDGRPATD